VTRYLGVLETINSEISDIARIGGLGCVFKFCDPNMEHARYGKTVKQYCPFLADRTSSSLLGRPIKHYRNIPPWVEEVRNPRNTSTDMTLHMDTPISLSPDTDTNHGGDTKLDPKVLLRTLRALRKGQFSTRITTGSMTVSTCSSSFSLLHFVVCILSFIPYQYFIGVSNVILMFGDVYFVVLCCIIMLFMFIIFSLHRTEFCICCESPHYQTDGIITLR
jgi:hypothetical protein